MRRIAFMFVLVGCVLLHPSATSFFVYEVDLGTSKRQDNPHPLLGPPLNISQTLPLMSPIVAFLDTGTGMVSSWIASAISGAIFETGRGRVPEPRSVLLLGAGLTGVSLWGWKRKKR